MSTFETPLSTLGPHYKDEVIDEAPPVLIRDLPRLVEPIVHFVHEYRPASVVANDRGARLAGVALFFGYSAYYGEPFPTTSHQLDFVYMSKSQPDLMNAAARLKAINDRSSQEGHRSDTGIDMMFLDDWIKTGETADLFLNTAKGVGLSVDRLAVATLCGRLLTDVLHIVGSPVLSDNSEWNAYEEVTGVEIPNQRTAIATANPNDDSRLARVNLAQATLKHYESKYKFVLS